MLTDSPDLFVDEDVVEEDQQKENSKWLVARRIINDLRERLDSLERLLVDGAESADAEALLERRGSEDQPLLASATFGKVMEGVFDGEHMVGEDGRVYMVPSNYASKSKLVEGDLLRLTITDAGRFVFKQKGPMERQRFMGILTFDDQSQGWAVAANGSKYRVLPASVSFFHGEPGDEVVIFVPHHTPSRWAAIENIIKMEG
ncbi:MAG: hypothetical protein Q7N87_02750 [Candidatus Uhrbacteria bacterium]|nr:hypothetical protein [Candidatus Uhrbacteria bacterium]